jgi:hypothetical protein
MNARTLAPMRRLSDFTPTDSIVGLIDSMPLPDEQHLQRIVEALARKLTSHVRYAGAVDALGDVHAALEDAKPASRDCDGCAGSGVNRHNGSGCIACHGRGEVVA